MNKIRNIFLLVCMFIFGMGMKAQGAVQIDIYGPGQHIVSLALATPLLSPNTAAKAMGLTLNKNIAYNLSFLPFMQITDPRAVLGGTVLAGVMPPQLDFRRFQIAGSDIVVTSLWANGDTGTKNVQIRAFETNTGKRLFGKEYMSVEESDLELVADRFSADLLKALTGNGTFFRSTIAFIKQGSGKYQADVWTVTPTGRDLEKVTAIKGAALSPSWSPDGRFIVFTHIDSSSHALGVWDRNSNKVQLIRFPGNTVIGPSFMPDNKVAVSLSSGTNPNIFLLNHAFQKEKVLEQNNYINVSPTFDASGTKMAFTSNRLGGPQIFLKDLKTGMVKRVSRNGFYNSEANLSPDGSLVVYSRMTDYGHRIFVQDMISGIERQISFGPGSDEQPSFCADSYFVAFASTRTKVRGIFLTTRHGGPAKKVPTGNRAASFPRWGLPVK